ncbi:MAG TPA: response regulator transcription factor [Burkholderiales bacterium]|nr:response regulator transcription factor [Burkholderiales bacterium]
MIRVLIVDDHAILRNGLKQILAETDDLRVEGEADSSQQALQRVREGAWDVIVLDINLPDRNGIETLKLIKQEQPKAHVVMLTMHPENHIALRALKAGASGYLTKQSTPGQIVAAIRQVCQGRKYVSENLAEALANALGVDVEKPAHEALSERELQTLRLIASGRTLTEIADELNLSVKTVSVYRARVLEKLNLKNNAELTHYGIKNRLVDLSQRP